MKKLLLLTMVAALVVACQEKGEMAKGFVKVENGHFCGYHTTREFESQEKAVEWVVKETNAKLQFTQ